MIDRFFEYLINKLYWEFRKDSDLPFGTFNPEPVIRFGGFALEEPYWNEEKKRVEVRRGWHTREPLLKMGDIPVYTRTIYLNELFLHKQMGLQVFFENKEEFVKWFNAEVLVEVVCHELAHAFLTDIYNSNYRVVGTVFGGLVGNLIGGAIEDRSMCIPSGILFTSERRNPLSFQFFWQTATMNRIPGTDRADFHNDKISCRSKDHLVELRDKIGSIVEICEFYTFSAYNRPSKEQDFKDKVRDLLYKHSEGEDVNGSYTIY